MPKGSANVIQKLLDEVHEKQRQLREEADAKLKRFMEEHNLTLFDMIVDYEIVTHQDLYPKMFDDFDLSNNDYKLQMTFETSFRKRTPEEREEFLRRIGPLVECDCGHYKNVHNQNFNVITNCLQPGCNCNLFIEKDSQVDFGGWEDH